LGAHATFQNPRTTPSGEVMFTPKYSTVEGEGVVVQGCNIILLVTEGRMQNFRTLRQPLLGEFGWGSFLFFPRPPR
jgi:hypothetical protein